jgi:predicted DNA-binding transcriptional regulator YafY
LILNLIRSRPGIKVWELAQESGVSQRTIYRDVTALGAEYAVYHSDGYRLLPTAYLKTLNLTQPEYRVVQMISSCPALKRPDLRSAARSLKAKLDTVTDPRLRKVESCCRHLFCNDGFGTKANSKKLEVICPILEKAIEHGRVVRLSLGRSKSIQSEIVFPYALVYYSYGWYLVGYCPTLRDFEAFGLNPVRRVSISNKTFSRDKDFSLPDFLDSRWGIKGGEETKVKVRFSGEAAREVLETKHHPRESILKIGKQEIIYTLTVKGTEGILRWILGFGPQAEVLSPHSLREQMRDCSERQAILYQRKFNLTKRKRELDSTSRIGC